MDTHKFSGKDQILIFDFLTRLVEWKDKLQMSEDQAYILLPQFLETSQWCNYEQYNQDHAPVELIVGRKLSSFCFGRTRLLTRFVTHVLRSKQYPSQL